MGFIAPITTSEGRRAADQDNRRDDINRREQEYHDQRMKSMQKQDELQGLQLEETRKNIPLNEIRRNAEQTSLMAKWAFQNIDRIPDDKLGDFSAELMTDMPLFEDFAHKDGQIVVPKTGEAMPVNRDFLKKYYAKLANPEAAMQLMMESMKPKQYVGKDGSVKTMTGDEAAAQGLTLASDAESGYKLKGEKVKADNAETMIGLDMQAKRAAIAAHNRAGKEPDVQFVSPDGKSITTMSKAQGQKLGLTPYSDFKATREMNNPKVDNPYSETSEEKAFEFALEQTMSDSGYLPVKKFNDATGSESTVYVDDAGNQAPPAVVQRASAIAAQTVQQYRSGQSLSGTRKAVAQKMDAPPVEGARRGRDGEWYVQKDGKTFKVVQ